MIVRLNESQRVDFTSGKYSGLQIFAYLTGQTNDLTLVTSDWNPVNTQVKVTLDRSGKQYLIMNDNLLLLGALSMRRNNFQRFTQGLTIQADAGGAVNIQMRISVLDFGGTLQIMPGDRLKVEVSLNGGFSANINSGASFLDVVPCPSTENEVGIPETRFEVIQTNAASQDCVNADNVREIQFLNFDLDTITATNQAVSNLSLSSDKLQYSLTGLEALAADVIKFPPNEAVRFGATQFASTVTRSWDYMPQSLSIYVQRGNPVALNNCKVSMNFNSANINASQNYVGFKLLKPRF